MRELMAAHRRNAVCATCHRRMDPLGFALENFDGIGRWRTSDGASPIDASGVLPDGTSFDGPASFREALVQRREEFVRTFTEKLLTYALGRPVGYHDMPAVRAILRAAAPGGYRWSSLILGIVESPPFQMRTAREADAGASEAAVGQVASALHVLRRRLLAARSPLGLAPARLTGAYSPPWM